MYQKKDYDLLNNALSYAKDKQKEFIKNFKINSKTKYNLNKNGTIIISKNKKKFVGKYEILGSYSYKTKFFRHSYANKFIKNPLNIISKRLQKDNVLLFNNPLYEGHKYGRYITSLALYKKKNILGYLVKHEENAPEIYLLIKSLKEINN